MIDDTPATAAPRRVRRQRRCKAWPQGNALAAPTARAVRQMAHCPSASHAAAAAAIAAAAGVEGEKAGAGAGAGGESGEARRGGGGEGAAVPCQRCDAASIAARNGDSAPPPHAAVPSSTTPCPLAAAAAAAARDAPLALNGVADEVGPCWSAWWWSGNARSIATQAARWTNASYNRSKNDLDWSPRPHKKGA